MSNNKPKPTVLIKKGGDARIRQVMMQFADGSNIMEGISSYAARRSVGVTLVKVTGAVANVVLRSSDSTFNLPGCYNVISLSGTMIVPPGGPVGSEAFTILLEGPQGTVTGGKVAGPLVAAGEVVLTALYFTRFEYYRLPPRLPAATVAGVIREEEEGVVAAPVHPLKALVDMAVWASSSTSSVPHTHF